MRQFGSIILFFSLIWSNHVYGQGIILDEAFTDWESITINFEDPLDDGGSSDIDFEKAWVSNDQDYLYLAIALNKEINLQDNNHIQIHIDIDNDVTTGNQTQGIGVDLMYDFGERMGLFYNGNTTTDVYHADIGLTAAPSVSSDIFEISILRDFIAWPNSITMGDQIRIFWKDQSFNGDIAPDNSGAYSFNFDNTLIQANQSYQITKKDEKHLRLLSYNVLFDSFFEEPNANSQERIIKALDPDIIAFQEIYDHTANETAEKVDELIPLSSGSWYRAKIAPDIICVSKYPIKFSDATNGNGYFILDMGAYDLLLVNAHLPCCDNNEDRQKEIDFILSTIRNMKDGTGIYPLDDQTPIIIVGDMNLVGDAQQQLSLRTGDIINEASFGSDLIPDWDGNSFIDANPPATHPSFHITWYDEYSSFSPGRLDYQFYTGSVLTAMNSFSLATMFLDPSELDSFGLFKNDSQNGSDHLPLVVDYLVNAAVENENFTVESAEIKIFPNPASEYIQISYKSTDNEHLILSCFNNLGIQLDLEFEIHGDFIRIDVSRFQSGTYWLKVTGQESVTLPFTVQH